MSATGVQENAVSVYHASEPSAAAEILDPRIPWLRSIYLILVQYFFYTGFVIGIPGNFMSILIMLQKDNRKLSTSVYMTSLAIVDSMTLICDNSVSSLFKWTVPYQFMYRGELLEFLWYLSFSCAISSGIFLMEMSIDRLLAVRFPMAAGYVCTASRARWTVCISFIIIFGINSNMFFVYKYSINPATGIETVKPSVNDDPSLETFGSTFQLVGGTVIPFIVIVFANVWIIITVRQASSQLKHLATSNDGEKKRKQETHHLTRMLILVSIFYVVCSIPYRAYEIAIDIPAVKAIYDFSNGYWFIRYRTEYISLLILWHLNYAVNFYLYCIGGKKFRKDAQRLLMGRCTMR